MCLSLSSTFQLVRLAPRRVLQELRVHLRSGQLHIFDHRATDEAILHRLHVGKGLLVLHCDVEELDVEVLIN